MPGAPKAFLSPGLLCRLPVRHLASSLLKVRQKGQKLSRDLGEGRRVTLKEPPASPHSSLLPKAGKRQPILNSHPCQTDWDCPGLWPCGVVPGTPARPSVATAKGLSLGREQQAGGQAGSPGVGEGGWQDLSKNLAEP